MALDTVHQVIGIFREVTVIGCALFGACIAYKGLSTWNRQLKGNARYEILTRLMKATFQLQAGLNQARSPFSPNRERDLPEEIVSKHFPEGLDKSDNHAMSLLSYRQEEYMLQNRWSPISTASSEIRACLMEAKIHFGTEFEDVYKQLFELPRELNLAINSHLYVRNPELSKEERFEEQKRTREQRELIYDGGDSDPFTLRLNSVVSVIEKRIRKKLGN
jgi:hypothetical protein